MTRKRLGGRVRRYFQDQRQALHLRLLAAHLVIALMPFGILGGIRSALYRLAGFKGIARRVLIFGSLDLRGRGSIYQNLIIGPYSEINTPCLIDLGGPVQIGSGVCIGHNTAIVTSNHVEGSAHKRCGASSPLPVTIGDGAWIACSVTILPGVEVGPGAVVTAGSVVTKSVPANAKVAGNPARVIGWLDAGPGDGGQS